FATYLVFVEPEVDVVAEVTAGLRAAGRVRAPNAASNGIGITYIVAILVAQERSEIPRRRETESHDDRVLRLIDELVNLRPVDTVEVAQVDVARNEAGLTRWTGSERPPVWRDERLWTVFGIGDSERRIRRAGVGRFVGKECWVPLQIRREASRHAI